MNHATNPSINISQITKKFSYSRGKLLGFLIVGALLAFELFNYSTTDFALNDLLGDLRFLGVRWATILAIAFCGIDFAGIARLFTPEQGENGPKEVWYLFSAWLLAASMNAMLTWWGVAVALVNHESLGSSVIARDTLLEVVPIFVAIMVWLIRVLIIGTFSMAGNRLFSQSETSYNSKPIPVMHRSDKTSRQAQIQPIAIRPAPKTNPSTTNRSVNRPEPTYHPAGLSGYNSSNRQRRQ